LTIQDPDRVLVEQARQGDTQAFGVLVERYQRLLAAIALGLLGDESKVEDVVQDAFVSAWKSLPGFRGEAKFRNWLCTILLNHARSTLRWSRLRRWISLSSPSGEGKVGLEERLQDHSSAANPERGIMDMERAKAVRV